MVCCICGECGNVGVGVNVHSVSGSVMKLSEKTFCILSIDIVFSIIDVNYEVFFMNMTVHNKVQYKVM